MDAPGRLAALEQTCGPHDRTLAIADWSFELAGLSENQAAVIDRRWAGFLTEREATPTRRLDLFDAGNDRWLPPWSPGETYRIEPLPGAVPGVRSYHFAVGEEPGRPGCWKVGVSAADAEPAERIVENALRWVVARTCGELGGVALHGAGLFDDGAAHVFAGPSNAGKTTAVSLCSPRPSLGDDFAVLYPSAGVWSAAAVPFDNGDYAAQPPPARDWLPLRAVWRLFQAGETRVEWPPRPLAAASLTACVAFPGTSADLLEEQGARIDELLGTVPLGHLYFNRAPGLWQRIEAALETN